MDPRDGSCHKCGSTCRAIGHQLKPGDIPVFDLATAKKVAEWCPTCRRVFCGNCCGASIGAGSMHCPKCFTTVEFAGIDHWR
jgi:hypothetical protein